MAVVFKKRIDYSRVLSPVLMGKIRQLDDFKRVEAAIMGLIKDKLVQTTFSIKARKRLSESLGVRQTGKAIFIESKDPLFDILVKGRRRKQMDWLARAKSPIPIITEQGEVIFRNANARTMLDGKWMHPGRRREDFVEKARAEIAKLLRKSFVEQLTRDIRALWTR